MLFSRHSELGHRIVTKISSRKLCAAQFDIQQVTLGLADQEVREISSINIEKRARYVADFHLFRTADPPTTFCYTHFAL